MSTYRRRRKYSTSEPNFEQLPFDRNGKATVKMSFSRKSVDPSRSDGSADNVGPAKTTFCQDATTPETESAPEEEIFDKIRALRIADGIKRLVLANEQCEKKMAPPQEDGRSSRKLHEGSPIMVSKKEHRIPLVTAEDVSHYPKSPVHIPTPPALTEIGSSNMTENDFSLSERKICKIVPCHDEMSCVSELTMESSAHLLKSLKFSRANPPPPPKRKNLQQKAIKAHPPPPPPPRSKSSPSISLGPKSPPSQKRVTDMPAAQHTPPLNHVDKILPASLSDSCTAELSHGREYEAARSPLPRKQSRGRSTKKPPPPPPQNKIAGKLKSPSPSVGGDFGATSTTRSFSTSEKYSSGISSSDKTSMKGGQGLICTSEETHAVRGGHDMTKSRAFEECRQPRSPLPRVLLNIVRQKHEIDKTSLPPTSSCQNHVSDGAVNNIFGQTSNGSTADMNTPTASLLEKKPTQGKAAKVCRNSKREIGESLPTRGIKDAAKHMNHPLPKNKMPPSPSQSKYDVNGRCIHHPSVIMARKKKFGRGWSIIRDQCNKCMQECSASSCSLQKDCVRAANSNIQNSKSGSEVAPSKRLSNIGDAKLLHRSRSNSCGNRTPSQTPTTKSHRSTDRVAKVLNMPFTTPWGKSGCYSGEVINGVPNGNGRMHFKNGDNYDGLWINGYSEQFLENSRPTQRSFSRSRSPWNEAIRSNSRHQKPVDSRNVKAYPEFHPPVMMQPIYYQPTTLPPAYYQPQHTVALFQPQHHS